MEQQFRGDDGFFDFFFAHCNADMAIAMADVELAGRLLPARSSISGGDFLGETWARFAGDYAKSLIQMVGAVGIEPTTSPV
jgi:hypothetical protein